MTQSARPWTPTSLKGTEFRAKNREWVRSETPRIFIDQQNNGNIVEIFEEFPFEVYNEEGTVFFPDQIITGKVYASYQHRNFHLYKRDYRNNKITDDILGDRRHDSVTKEVVMYGSKTNWLSEPTPILKTSKGKPTKDNIIPAINYRIDFEKGMVIFKHEPQGTVYADYGYYQTTELEAVDYDIQNGIFYLNENVTFKDNLYSKYEYYEDFLDYKGYYDDELGVYFHLDLNPSVGHYSTLPTVVYINGEKRVEYQKRPSSNLLNKMIHIYLAPDSEGGSSVRHCFSQEEWRKIQEANPMLLLLARVQVREHTTVNDVVVMDARVRGGGVSESLSVKAIDERVKGRQRYWDIGNWDGKAFYRNGVLVITLPKKILVEYGGTLTEDYVRESIDKHVAYGTYCIIEWE